MDNNKEKVNSAENIQTDNIQKPRDEIIDGFYDLSQLYNKPSSKARLTREEQLRLKEEKRRELEMQAIKEDIERRYSLQLEDARAHSDTAAKKDKPSLPKNPIMPEIDERETVREELDRIDEIINSRDIVNVTDKKQNKQDTEKIEKEKTDTNSSVQNPVYDIFYSFGDTICRVLVLVFTALFKTVKIPFVHLHRIISKATESTKRKGLIRIRSTVKEIVHFKTEIKRAGRTIKKALKSPRTLPAVIRYYFKKAFKTHEGLLKTAANILMPVGALAIFLITLNFWNSVTFALEVIYNDQSIGYISDESVYIEARDLVKDRLSSGAYSSDSSNIEATVAAASASNLNARYTLTLVSLDQLNDAQAISDKMIENSVDNLTHACGIYIDGEFICAVKNEADAKTVFYDILAPYEADAEANNYVVGFAETIDYVQGLYRDDKTVMWDASELSGVLTGKGVSKSYTVLDGETIESVVENTGIDEDTLRELNPSYDFENLGSGDTLITEEGEKLVSIKKIITTSSINEIKYDTVKKRDATKYSGYRKVIQKGVNGSERVTKTQIYIDGELYDTEYSYETITEPVDEIVTVGSKTSYGGVYIGEASDSGFLWPAPSCHKISSPYGWRSSGWHNGVDLVKSGGGALGTPVIASKSGRVEVVQRSNSGYGNMVLINHGDGYKTRYAHMVKGSITVSVGDYVDAGQTIGKVGSTGNSTGPHLHFEVIKNGETKNPKNYIY